MAAITQNENGFEHATARQLRAAVDAAVDAIIIIDGRGRIQTFNQAAERMFGYSRDELLGKNVRVLMPQPMSDQHDTYLENYLQTGVAKVIGIGRETLALKKDGTVFPVDLSVSEAIEEGSRTFTGVIRDMSERRRLDAEILSEDLRERQRIGYDLHDGLCQELAGIAFTVRSIQERAFAGEAIDHAALGNVTGLLQDAVRHVRGLAQDLYPVRGQPDGLVVALMQLAADATQLLKIRCRFQSAPPVHMQNATTATYLYRIAQEAVRDAVTASGADKVEIQLCWKRSAIVLIVADNGADISVEGRFGEGIVFRIMKHWAGAIGAKLEIRQGAGGKGAHLTCEVDVHT
jgi:two-component system sensor kinase FixL